MKRLAVPLFLALLVRLCGLAFGLPRLLPVKDEQRVVGIALAMFSGDRNPHEFLYPSLPFYMLHAAQAPLVWWLEASGQASGIAELIGRFDVDPTPFFLATRAISLLAGLATVVLAGALGRRLGGEWCGPAAATVVALSPLHVELSRFARFDSMLVLWTTAALFTAARYRDESRLRDAVLTSLFAGLALATKYSAVFLMPIVFMVATPRPNAGPAFLVSSRAKRVALLGTLPFVILFATSPYIFLDWRGFWTGGDVISQLRLVTEPYGFRKPQPGYSLYPGLLAGAAYGAGFLAASLFGLFLLLRRRHRALPILLVFGLGYALVFFLSTNSFPRYLLPLIPLLAAWAGVGIVWTATRLRRPVWILLLLSFAPSAPYLASRVVVGIANADTRLRALRFVEERVPSGATILAGASKRVAPLASQNAPMLGDQIALRPNLSKKGEYSAAALAAREFLDASGYPLYKIERVRANTWEDAARAARPFAILLSPQELVAPVAADLQEIYGTPTTFAPGWFCDGNPNFVFLKKDPAEALATPPRSR